MQKRKLNNQGFGLVAVLVVVLVLVAVGGAGYLVWHKNEQKSAQTSKASTKTTNPKAPPSVELKTYSNDEYGFSFQYPETWKLTTDLSDIGRGQNEGDIVVTSPTGTKVHFGPNLGGKGGECADENEQYTTQTCSTRNVLSVEKLSNGSTKQIYFYHFSLTDPVERGGKTIYYVDIGNSPYAPTETGPTVGVFLYPYDEINLDNISVTVYVEGEDDDKNSSSAFFETNEVKEATPILKSFKSLQ